MGGAVAIRACHDGSRWFDRMILSAPMIALPPGRACSAWRGRSRVSCACSGAVGPMCRAATPMAVGTEHFLGNVLTSDPVRFARNAAVLEDEPELGLGPPTIAWADSALRLMKQFAEPAYAGQLRQPILLVAAGRDEVVSTPAIETFGSNLLAGRHLILPGARHEILQEQDLYRGQFWAAFDAFVPGTPLY